MKKYNVILLYHQDGQHLLMCRRQREPYIGKYNLVGGKVEPGEAPLDAAYRELLEETSISRADVTLHPLFTTHYWQAEVELQVFMGKLRHAVSPQGDENPLLWMPLSENFFDTQRFAGAGNIGHMVLEASLYTEKLFAED